MKIWRILVGLVLTGFSTSVQAQDLMNAVLDVNSQFQSTLDFARTVTLNSAIEAAARNAASRSSSSNTHNSSSQALRFQSSTAVSQQVRNQFIQALKKASPQFTDEIKQKLQQQDVIGDFARDMAPYGLRADDVADTMTAYWLTMWLVANQEQIPSVTKVKAVQNQVRTVMLHNEQVIQAPEATRQTMAEIMIYETMIVLGLRANANRTGHPAQLQQLANSAYQNMLKQGINLRELKLTSSGFVGE